MIIIIIFLPSTAFANEPAPSPYSFDIVIEDFVKIDIKTDHLAVICFYGGGRWI